MQRYMLFLVGAVFAAGSVAHAQGPAVKVPSRNRKVSTQWASADTSAPADPGDAAPAIPTPASLAASPLPAEAVGPVGGPAACAPACASCGGDCLGKLKNWLCYRPLHDCDKVCYRPVPQLYLFFLDCRQGYCPKLAPEPPCPPCVHVVRPPCPACRPCKACKSPCDDGAAGCPAALGLPAPAAVPSH